MQIELIFKHYIDLSGEFLKIGNEQTQELADRRRQTQSKTYSYCDRCI